MDDAQGSGWVTFSAVILVFAGLMKLFDSIWAFRTKGQLEAVGGNAGIVPHATLGSTISNYGWYWLFLGIVLILAGFAVVGGSQLGRWIGIGAAAVGAIGTMAWMPYYPIWAFTYFVIAILVMYGLAAHGAVEVPAGMASAS